jgi:hypothetical protein
MITLATIAPTEKDVLKQYVIYNLLREIKAAEILPFQNVDALKSLAVRVRTLPTNAFRKINAGYTQTEGSFEQVWESVFGFGGEIGFDRVFEKIKNVIIDPKRAQIDLHTRSMGVTFNNYWINGDHAVDPDGFEGLRKRVSLMPARQTVFFAGAAAAGLDPTASVANGNLFWTHLEEMHVRTNGGQHNAWFMNEGMKLGLGRTLRFIQASAGNWLSTTKDSFDRDVPTLWGSSVYDMGLLIDQATEIITATEPGGTGVLNTTSLYCASFNEQQGVVGIQLGGPMDVYDPLNGGEQEALPAKMVRIDWWCGLAGFGSYGIARGRNVESAGNWTA